MTILSDHTTVAGATYGIYWQADLEGCFSFLFFWIMSLNYYLFMGEIHFPHGPGMVCC